MVTKNLPLANGNSFRLDLRNCLNASRGFHSYRVDLFDSRVIQERR